MEALVAVGLASNILQFVDFSAKLIRISNELRNDATSSENKDHQVITTHMKALAQGISDSAKAISQTSTTASPEEKALQPVAFQCCKLADSLLDRLKKCGIQHGQNNSRLQRVKTAFKAIWNKREIEEISNRLQFFRSELTLHYISQSRQTQLHQVTRQSTTDDIRSILGRLNDLKRSIDDVKSDLGRTANNQHFEILNFVKEAQNENTLFHTQAAQQAIANRSLVNQGLGDLRASIEDITTGLQHIQVRQSETLDSLAHVKVENSAFFATVTQRTPLASDSSTLVHALRPLLEQYKDEILIGVKKEYQSAARSGFDSIIQNAPAALDEIQHRSRTAQQDSERAVVESKEAAEIDLYTSKSYITPFEDPNPLLLKRRALGRLDRNSITMLYYNCWRWKTALGNLMLSIRDKVHFNEYGRPTKMYELTVQLIPSLSWLSTGFSMTYENKTDARGAPEFGIRLKTYRVLPNDHEVIRAIEDGDVYTVQNMLSQKLVSPSGRDTNGRSLLMIAVEHGELDICKALVQSGADINARNIDDNAIALATTPYCLANIEGRAIFHYLLGLPEIEIECFWQSGWPIELAINSVTWPGLPNEKIKESLEDWVSVCQFISIDFNALDKTFLELVVDRFSWGYSSDNDTLEDLVMKFDLIVQQIIGLTDSVDPMGSLSMGRIAFLMLIGVLWAFSNSLMAHEPSHTLSIPYRGYFLHTDSSLLIEFLDHVALKKIAECPSCIFDNYRGLTALDWVSLEEHTQDIWIKMLEDCGFDVDWVYEEDSRRRRVVLGESSTHDISIGPDTSKILDVRRRRGYDNSDE
ncbi:hypothetical protein F5Y00DRAFT_256898 [Daldinia vernicosa]|uniref:uncharacterized protein n=1 Tax=Daldinia vernicosa TaxID=114800 RepID=UPI00200730D7|nr:uncharacterized protein F5Y00DRAFT_256898 [Daldinia vernicosa]KAI0854404.1 hypothetical protein F5Y00DRAFT_256898 [Daldinia vernicosa]